MLRTLQSNMVWGEWGRHKARLLTCPGARVSGVDRRRPVAHAGYGAATYDIAVLFHNFNTITPLLGRRAKTMHPEVATASTTLY